MSTPRNTPTQHTSEDGYTGMPRWVKVQILVLAIFVVAVIVFIVVYSLAGGATPVAQSGTSSHAAQSAQTTN